jgi:adenine deaminase
LHDELRTLVNDVGLSPLEALRTATLNPATYFGAADSMGTIAVGKVADLVLLRGNPLDDIRGTETVDGVMLRGRFFDHAALDGMLQAVEKDASSRTFVNFVVISTDSGFVTSTDSSMLWTRPQNVASDGRTPLPQTADCRPRS